MDLIEVLYFSHQKKILGTFDSVVIMDRIFNRFSFLTSAALLLSAWPIFQ